MENNKIKVSDLPESKDTQNLWVHGYTDRGGVKESVKVSAKELGGKEAVFDTDLEVNIKEGKSFGKWVKGDIIPAKGKTAMQVIIEALTEEDDTKKKEIYYGALASKPTQASEIDVLSTTSDTYIESWMGKRFFALKFPKNKYEIERVLTSNLEDITGLLKMSNALGDDYLKDFDLYLLETAVSFNVSLRITLKEL